MCIQVLLAFVSNMTGKHKSYSQNNVNMIIADVMAITIFVFCVLAVEFWTKLWCYILSVCGFTYLYFLAWRVSELCLGPDGGDKSRYSANTGLRGRYTTPLGP